MPRRDRDMQEDDKDEESPRNNIRRSTKPVSYSEDNNVGENDDDAPMEIDSASENEDVEGGISGSNGDGGGDRRRSARARSNSASAAASKENVEFGERRTSSRATKFKSSMRETDNGDLLFKGTNKSSSNKNNTKKSQVARKQNVRSKNSTDNNNTSRRQQRNSTTKGQPMSPHKPPARRHRHSRMSIGHSNNIESDSDASGASDVDDEESDFEDRDDDDDDLEEEEEPFKIQRILASRTATRKEWAMIGAKMNTTEIDYGSRWVQDYIPEEKDDDTFEERFLVKWSDISHLHVSWETESDLLEQVENAKNYLSTFFRKSSHGVLFSSDERCDGEYFDPAWVQVDRILEVHFPESCPIKSVKNEDVITNEELGIVVDKKDDGFTDGLGREFLVKWGNTPYSESTYEFERDLILNEVDYKAQLKAFQSRKKKPTKEQAKKALKQGEAESRRLYKYVFGDNIESKEEAGVERYQKNLEEHVFKNGGQLRDYQAEGVSWMMANYINKRGGILADEMGLGKTIQTASFINLLATQLYRRGPFLIVAPLSTLAHWQREFEGWTMLNTIVYHGSAKDRQIIRELEIAHESNRPSGGVGFNQLYLRKCRPKKNDAIEGNPWMAEVVITTPELLCAEDWQELTAIDWECLVVDEAHRLKNHASKLVVNLKDAKFVFKHKILLTGTPIQNSMQELHSLLSFVSPDLFHDVEVFLEKYGDMKSKDRIDELHEEIRPFILRRLKEDVEKSVPPKEETVIEVELTVAQKQYYRALYEKNVKFLHKNKKKALDGPSLNNLAMQLRKCCNHLFLLNGIEEEYREKQKSEGQVMPEGDLLASASGKLVLLDKLLPRLKENGHRILIFSQFKIMLDVLEDYLSSREVNFERIDGSITGNKRQQAIDRFQAPHRDEKESPFIMLLSTRAGGVGINLTAADTCIIFDSDWNPQNDLQAQARCHRIGQTKNVKVYRLLTAKTYEMQMFHMSSLKMGLDQAVLSGFEAGTSGEGALSKDEVEKLLKHGAYGIFSEENDGDKESNNFLEQDIDTILERRSRTVVHENTGSQGNAAGGTFSKARFTAPKAAEDKKTTAEDVDVDDPNFWEKVVGVGTDDAADDALSGQRRKRKVMNYSEGSYEKRVDESLRDSEADDDDDESADESYGSDDEDQSSERFRWGGSKPKEWKKDEAKVVVSFLQERGYDSTPATELLVKSAEEIQRMCWSILLMGLCEIALEDATQTTKRAARVAEKKRESSDSAALPEGGVLAILQTQDSGAVKPEVVQHCFKKLWYASESWVTAAFNDALTFARSAEPRDQEALSRGLQSARSAGTKSTAPLKKDEISALFSQNVWPSLKSRGWKAVVLSEGPNAGKTQYSYGGKQYYSAESVLGAVGSIHLELANMVESMLGVAESSRQKSIESEAKLREIHLAMKPGSFNVFDLEEFLKRYAPLQLLCDRKSHKRLHLGSRKTMQACTYLHTACALVRHAENTRGQKSLVDQLSTVMSVDKRMTLPHPLWSTRHDGILIHAIVKHGWIDSDAAVRRITNDATIKWGFPFDSDHIPNEPESETISSSKKTSQRDEMIANLRQTAVRAASFFNAHSNTLEEKGLNTALNKNMIIRAYGLMFEHNSDDEGDGETDEQEKTTKSQWILDDDQLLVSTGLETAAESLDFVDLPTKKDLVKRAKLILTKNVDLQQAEPAKVNADTPSDLYVLDQSDRCNVLLAEILRAITKAPPKAQNSIRVLFAVAAEEAQKRRDSVALSTDGSRNDLEKAKRAWHELDCTVKQIDSAKRHFKQSSRQAKNILRVILGLEIAKSGKAPNFPTKVCPVDSNTNKPKSKNGQQDGSTGDRALAKSMARCLQQNAGRPGPPAPEGQGSDLELTAIETLIVSVVCSQGLPTFTKSLDALLNDTPSSPYRLGWRALGAVLLAAAREWHETAERKTQLVETEWKKVEDSEPSATRDRICKSMASAIKIEEAKELAASQAQDYAADPSILAKKTIMLIERIRKKMGQQNNSKSTKKSNYWLGPKIFDFLSTQLSDWAKVLDIVDAKGKTLSYTAADFYHDLPVDERELVEVTTLLNKQDSRQIIIQITLLSRLRSLFSAYPKDALLPKIEKAAKNVGDGDVWEGRPSWWTTSGDSLSHNDALLLEALVEFGFGGVLTHAKVFNTGEPGKPEACTLMELGLTKSIVQQRANQLARELHNLERSSQILKNIEGRKEKGKLKTGGKKQTALSSFFAKSAKKSANVAVLTPSEIPSNLQETPTMSTVATGSKRFGDLESETSASPEKKARLEP